jgi:DNA polymerase-1
MYAQYKETRSPMPDELRPQIPYIRKLVTALRLPVIEERGVEADDVIGTLAVRAAADDLETVIVTADKDMMQLVNEQTTLFDDIRGRKVGIPEVRERFGVDPAFVPDVLGLMGDAIDNIPGVTGVGQKTASALVSQLGTVETILDRLDEVERLPGLRGAKKVRAMLEAEADTARLSKNLATIKRDVDVTIDWEALRWPGPDVPTLRPLLMELEFMVLLRELAPTGPAATADLERREARSPGEVRAALAALAKAPAVSVFAVLDSPRATAGALTALVLRAPGAPPVVLTAPEDPADLWRSRRSSATSRSREARRRREALRVALARRRVAFAGAGDGLRASRPTVSIPHSPCTTRRRWRITSSASPPSGRRPSTRRAARPPSRTLKPVVDERLAAPRCEALPRARFARGRPRRHGARRGRGRRRRAGRDVGRAGAGARARLRRDLRAGGRRVQHRLADPAARGPVRSAQALDEGHQEDEDRPLDRRRRADEARRRASATGEDSRVPADGEAQVDVRRRAAGADRSRDRPRAHVVQPDDRGDRPPLELDPNLQNIPIRTEEGRRIREAFVARPGSVVVSADYSQIELRVLAHLANDAALIDAFTRGDDIHARTAADVFGAMSAAEGRRLAKVINYGIVYGMGPARAARELGVSMKEAETYIREYFARYAGVRDYLDATIRDARARSS